jgi:hypothetical protein
MRKTFKVLCAGLVMGALIACSEPAEVETKTISLNETFIACSDVAVSAKQVNERGPYKLWEAVSKDPAETVYFVSYETDQCILGVRHAPDQFAPIPHFYHMSDLIVPDNYFKINGIEFPRFAHSRKLENTLVSEELAVCLSSNSRKTCVSEVSLKIGNNITFSFRVRPESSQKSEIIKVDIVGNVPYLKGEKIHG